MIAKLPNFLYTKGIGNVFCLRCFFSLIHVYSPGSDLIYQTIKCYTKTLQSGSKYVYQTMPRLLTLWLDLGDTDNT